MIQPEMLSFEIQEALITHLIDYPESDLCDPRGYARALLDLHSRLCWTMSASEESEFYKEADDAARTRRARHLRSSS